MEGGGVREAPPTDVDADQGQGHHHRRQSQEFDLEKELEHGMDDSQQPADQQEEPTPPDEPAVQEAEGPWSQEPTE